MKKKNNNTKGYFDITHEHRLYTLNIIIKTIHYTFTFNLSLQNKNKQKNNYYKIILL